MISDAITHPRHRVINRDHLKFPLTNTNHLTGLHDFEADTGLILIRQLGKIRPYNPVKDMRLQRLYGFFLGMHNNRFVVNTKHTVCKQWQAGDVIHVGMSQKDMPNARHLVQG